MARKRETRRYRREKMEVITRALREGVTLTTALRVAGIAKDTYYRWLRAYPKFAEECEQATGHFFGLLERTAVATALTDPAMLRWLLERRHPDYKPASKLDVLNESYRVVLEVADEGSDADYEIILANPADKNGIP